MSAPSTHRTQQNLLSSLKLRDTLEKLELINTNCDTAFIVTIATFANLKELKLSGSEQVSSDQLAILGQLKHLRVFFIRFYESTEDLSAVVVDLVYNWPLLQSFELSFSTYGWGNGFVENKLTNILKDRNYYRPFSISIREDFVKISTNE